MWSCDVLPFSYGFLVAQCLHTVMVLSISLHQSLLEVNWYIISNGWCWFLKNYILANLYCWFVVFDNKKWPLCKLNKFRTRYFKMTRNSNLLYYILTLQKHLTVFLGTLSTAEQVDCTWQREGLLCVGAVVRNSDQNQLLFKLCSKLQMLYRCTYSQARCG